MVARSLSGEPPTANLQLDRNTGVLLFPERNERIGDPDPDGRQRKR